MLFFLGVTLTHSMCLYSDQERRGYVKRRMIDIQRPRPHAGEISKYCKVLCDTVLLLHEQSALAIFCLDDQFIKNEERYVEHRPIACKNCKFLHYTFHFHF